MSETYKFNIDEFPSSLFYVRKSERFQISPPLQDTNVIRIEGDVLALNQDIVKWLDDNHIDYLINVSSVQGEAEQLYYRNQGCGFRQMQFENKSDAMLFKLTFC